MTHPYDILSLDDDISLIFTPCPGTKDTSVEDGVQTLAEAGAKAIVTLMPDAEMEKFNAQNLPDVCKANGLAWFQFPIEDDSGPGAEFEAAFSSQKQDVLDLLKAHKTVAIHCRGGSGRTGFMAAILLLEMGLNWAVVKQEIQGLRPKALTKEAQLAYLADIYNIAG